MGALLSGTISGLEPISKCPSAANAVLWTLLWCGARAAADSSKLHSSQGTRLALTTDSQF